MARRGPADGAKAPGDDFTAKANGDLNGNGVFSTFSVSGSAYSGVVGISPNVQETNPEE